MKGQGWCTHPKRQQTGGILLLVRANALDCRNSWGEDFWTPKDANASESVHDTTLPADFPASDAAPVHATATDDLVIQHTSLNEGDRAAMTNSSQPPRDDDESINHAALSDQEDRAHVMARGAREAILRARERKKERTAPPRQPRVSPLPAADSVAGEWGSIEDVQDDEVLTFHHRSATAPPRTIDPFRRSYNDPAPPVPSGELSAEARGIVTWSQDDRFETVPEVRPDFALPRPDHFASGTNYGQMDGADDVTGDPNDENQLPDDPALSSYDRVLQRARRFQRLSVARGPRRTIHRPSGPSDSVAATAAAREPNLDRAPTFADAHIEEEPIHQARDVTGQGQAKWYDDSLAAAGQVEEADSGFTGVEEEVLGQQVHVAGLEPAWDDEGDPFPESPEDPWLVAESLAFRHRDQTRPRFRLPQLSFRRHGAQLKQAVAPTSVQYDEEVDEDFVEHTAWAGSDPDNALAPQAKADPDWADEAVPVESYAAGRPALTPADESGDASGRAYWDEEWNEDEETQHLRDDRNVIGRAAARTRFPVTVERTSSPIDDAWPEGEEDFVTSEATVPHRPLPAPPTLDLANVRARLFAQREPASDERAHDTIPHFRRPQPAPEPARLTGIAHFAASDDDDPDPGPGAGFETPRPGFDATRHERTPEGEFDIRAVVRRQDELLDMRIEIAPDVPRMCRTCRNFRPAEGGERGWCTNEWAFSHRRMVNADDLPCEGSIGCWWLPRDETWLPDDDLASLTQPTPLIDRLLGRLRIPRERDEHEEPLRANAR